MIKSSSEGRQGLNHANEQKMNEVPQIISTVDEACTFISRWFGWKDNLAGPQITLPFTVPQAIETVNRRLGRLWLEDRQAHGEIDIFGSQDSLISPHQYQARPDGIVPMIWENQGVWGGQTGNGCTIVGYWRLARRRFRFTRVAPNAERGRHRRHLRHACQCDMGVCQLRVG
jgi:hypothetical protein